MFAIVFSEEALHQLGKLDNVEAKRIAKKLKESAEDPSHYFARLSGREEYKLRVGDYRLIVNVLQAEQTIMVRSIGHRKNIYEKR